MSGRVRTAGLFGLALLPFVYLAAMLWRFHLDAPYLDQWEFVLFLDKAYRGGLGFADFWAQHNEHRLVFPRLIMLGLARLTHWDIRWELAASLTMAAATFGLIAAYLSRCARREGGQGAVVLVPVVSLLVFSMSQWQNWFLGWQLQEFLNVLAVVGGCLALAGPRSWGRIAIAALCGVVATYSFANGMAFWPIGAVILGLCAGGESPGRRPALGVWLAVFAVVAATYLYHYERPEHHPGLGLVLTHPLHYAAYVLAFLGGPLVAWSEALAAVAGAAGLGMLVALLASALRRKACGGDEVMFPLGLGLYALATAMITGAGRLGFGIEQALSSRYATFGSLLWLALLLLAWQRFRPARGRGRRVVLVAGVAFFALLVGANSAYGTSKWTERYRHRLPAQVELVSGDNLDLLQRLHPEPELIVERREVLRRHGLSVFRK